MGGEHERLIIISHNLNYARALFKEEFAVWIQSVYNGSVNTIYTDTHRSWHAALSHGAVFLDEVLHSFEIGIGQDGLLFGRGPLWRRDVENPGVLIEDRGLIL
jgi:hypothetical protein